MVIHSRHWKSLDNQDIILYHTNNHNKSKSGISLVETLPNGIYSTMVAFPDGIPNDQRLWLLFLTQLIQLALVFQQLSQQRLHCGSEDVGFILRKRKMEISQDFTIENGMYPLHQRWRGLWIFFWDRLQHIDMDRRCWIWLDTLCYVFRSIDSMFS